MTRTNIAASALISRVISGAVGRSGVGVGGPVTLGSLGVSVRSKFNGIGVAAIVSLSVGTAVGELPGGKVGEGVTVATIG